jgi:oxygen-dependent protoporphyrinogen oxidase
LRVAIVGGGISGLTAGLTLAARGNEVAVIDDAPVPGGLIASVRRDGFLCERGPQAVLDGAEHTRALIAAVGLADRVQVAAASSKRRFVFVDGALRPFPASPPALLKTSLLSVSGKLRLLREPFVAEGDRQDESVLDFVARRFGREAAERAAAPAVIGIYAGDAATLSVRTALPRLAAMEEEHGSVLRALLRGRDKFGLGRPISFPEGLAELPAAIAARLGPRCTRGRATSLRRVENNWRITVAGGATLDVDRVVLATPAEATATLLEPFAPQVGEAFKTLVYAPVAVVCLGFTSAEGLGIDLDAYGFVVARGERVRVLGCQYESSVFPGRAPPGAVLVRALIGGTFDPGIVEEEDATIWEQVVADLRRVAGLRREPEFVDVWRARPGIPQYDLAHRARIRAVDDAIGKLPGLTVIGNTLRGIGVNDCIRAGASLA